MDESKYTLYNKLYTYWINRAGMMAYVEWIKFIHSRLWNRLL
jgi:hypothetical protein